MSADSPELRVRPDQVRLGWQFRQDHPDPGPPPRRPVPPEHDRISDDWVAAQRREENLINRPLKAVLIGAAAGVVVFLVLTATGAVNSVLGAILIGCCLVITALTAYATWQGGQALKERIREEQERLDRIRTEKDRRLRIEQEEHAELHHVWQERREEFERQRPWQAVALPPDVNRVDLAGGTLVGWSAAVTMIGAARLAAGGDVIVLDLSDGAVATDLVAMAERSGVDPLVWVLPADLPRLDLGLGLGREATADLLSLVVSVSEKESSTRDLSFDNSILDRLLGILGEGATIASVAAALRALAQVGDPRDDVRAGLLTPEQVERITTLYGQGATDRVVIERAWALEAQLRKLESLGTRPARMPRSRLRVVATDRRSGVFGNKVLGTYAVTALTHLLRQAPEALPWQHTLIVCGAEKLRGDVLDRLTDACESTRAGLVLAYRSLGAPVKERLGRGHAAVAYMRLGNAEDAKAAAEQLGTEHRFVLSQLTETVGSSITDTLGDSYTSTVGTSDSTSTTYSESTSKGRSRGSGHSDDGWLLSASGTFSSSRDANSSFSTSDSTAISEGINASTAWGRNTSRAIGTNESQAQSLQRSREFLVEQHELQQLPATAMIITYADASGRRLVLADVNPALHALENRTIAEFDGARRTGGVAAPVPEAPVPGAAAPAPLPPPDAPEEPAQAGPAARPVVPSRVDPPSPMSTAPPNLGPPPERLDWRTRRPRR